MEGEIREKTVKGRSATGSLARVMRGRDVSMEVKRSLRKSILLPTLTYGSDLDVGWGTEVKSACCGNELPMSKRVCGVTRQGESNESLHERCSMGTCANGVKCGVVE